MARGRTRNTPLTPPRGYWLALFAATIQVLLPFLVALDLALVSDPAYAGRAVFVCAGERQAAGPAPHQERRQTHHGLSAGCPLCAAVAAGHGFVAAQTPTAPPPRDAAFARLRPLARTPFSAVGLAPYRSRAPPTIA
jgi:Protein of unknown function (DUF2946)